MPTRSAACRMVHICRGSVLEASECATNVVAALRASAPAVEHRVITVRDGGGFVPGPDRTGDPRGRASLAWLATSCADIASADLVSVHAPFALAALAVVLRLPRSTVLTVHWHGDRPERELARRPGASLHRMLLSRADAIAIADPDMAAAPLLAPHRQKVTVVPHGIDPDGWSTLLDPDAAWRTALLRSCYPRLIVAAGGLRPQCRLDTLIDALRDVDGFLFVIGDGPSRGFLERQVAETGLSSRVTFCGQVAAGDLRLLLRSASLCVIPRAGGDAAPGITQLEAMACGCPVVVMASASGRDFAAPDRHATLVVPSDQWRSLAEAMALLLENRDAARRLGNAARAYVGQHHALSVFRARIQRLYGGAMLRRYLSAVWTLEQPAAAS